MFVWACADEVFFFGGSCIASLVLCGVEIGALLVKFSDESIDFVDLYADFFAFDLLFYDGLCCGQ